MAEIFQDWTWIHWLGAAAVGLASIGLSLVIVCGLLVAIPPTFFLEGHERDFWIDRHPVQRWAAKIAKNVLGLSLVLLGILLSVPGIPGQGLLTILIGISLLDFPGKRRLERKILGQPRVLKAINGLRNRFGKPPLEI